MYLQTEFVVWLLAICSSVFISRLIPLHSERPVMPANWPSPSHGRWGLFCFVFSRSDFFRVFLSHLKQMREQQSFHSLACQVKLLTDLFCDLQLVFLFSIGKLWNKAGAAAHPCSQEIFGWWSFVSEEPCCSLVP